MDAADPDTLRTAEREQADAASTTLITWIVEDCGLSLPDDY